MWPFVVVYEWVAMQFQVTCESSGQLSLGIKQHIFVGFKNSI